MYYPKGVVLVLLTKNGWPQWVFCFHHFPTAGLPQRETHELLEGPESFFVFKSRDRPY